MPFVKYTEIENSYQTKEREYWLERFPSLVDESYIMQEKVDGSNVSLIFEANGSFQLAKRSGIIDTNENFYNIQSVVLRDYADVVAVVQSFAKTTKSSVNLYGELFGKGIQNRINYGDTKRILFFDVTLDGKILRGIEVEDFFSSLNIEDVLMPNFGVIKGLENALNFDVENRLSLVYPEGEDFIEGVVIKPYYPLDYLESEHFYFKKKAEKFAERSKPKKERQPVDDKLVELQNLYKSYINESRVLSAFSKYGEIEKAEDIGKYIKIVLEDAKKDFVKDNEDILYLDKKELKFIYNVSKEVVEILKRYL